MRQYLPNGGGTLLTRSLCAVAGCRLIKNITKMFTIKNDIITLYFIAQLLGFLCKLLILTVSHQANHAFFIVLLICLLFWFVYLG